MKDRILKRFNDEISALERELKVDLPKEIQRARELGDLRENAEYKAAKERQEIVNARIAMLKKRVGEIALINMDRIPHGRAGFGSTVEPEENWMNAVSSGLTGCTWPGFEMSSMASAKNARAASPS